MSVSPLRSPLHPRLTPANTTAANIGGVTSKWLAQIGPTGAWDELSRLHRFGDGACGLYETSWKMPLPPGFEHPLLRRGTIVELMDGARRVGSPLILSEPAVGSDLSEPWTFTATGVGREVEGDSTWFALDGSGDVTTSGTTAVTAAIARGLPVAGYTAGFPSAPFASIDQSAPFSIGTLLTTIGNAFSGQRWGVGQDNLFDYYQDPTTPIYHVVPGVAELGTADDDYATVVYLAYNDSGTGTFGKVFSPASASATEQRFGRREALVDLTNQPAMTSSTAQSFADGILAKYKGRLAWGNSLTLTSNEILTSGGVPADLGKVAEDVGTGCMVRLHGIFSDLLEFNGQTWLDVVMGQATYIDGAPTIDLAPLGLAARDLASVIEAVTGRAAAA